MHVFSLCHPKFQLIQLIPRSSEIETSAFTFVVHNCLHRIQTAVQVQKQNKMTAKCLCLHKELFTRGVQSSSSSEISSPGFIFSPFLIPPRSVPSSLMAVIINSRPLASDSDRNLK